MAGEIVNPEDLPEDINIEPPGTPVSVTDLPPEYAHRKLMAEQQGPPPVPTIAGGPPTPKWVNATEEFLLGNSPYDPVKWLKEKLVAPPQPEDPSVFGKTVDTSLRGLMDILMPNSVSEGILQAGVGYGTNKVIKPIANQLTRGLRAVRPLAREIADEGIGKALITPEALKAEAFYNAADLSGKTVPIGANYTMGTAKMAAKNVHHLGFKNAQEMAIQLRRDAKKFLEVDKLPAKADQALKNAKLIEDSIESVFPGYAATKSGYARIKNINRVQELVGTNDPLDAFELSIREGRAVGPEGLILQKGGDRTSRFLNATERKDVLDILEELGPKPGDSLFQKLAIGRGITGGIGAMVGYDRGGYAGAAQGMAVGVLGPAALNWMIRQSLSYPATRAFLKRTMSQKGGLGNPTFWSLLGALGERAGMNMFNPPPPPEMQQAMDAMQQQAQPPMGGQ